MQFTRKQILTALEVIEAINERADKVANALGYQTGFVQVGDLDSNSLKNPTATITYEWDEHWNFGGYENHHDEIPLRFILASEDEWEDMVAEHLAEQKDLADKKAEEKAAREAKIQEAKDRVNLARLKAKLEGDSRRTVVIAAADCMCVLCSDVIVAGDNAAFVPGQGLFHPACFLKG